jgi:hypothetical protein
MTYFNGSFLVKWSILLLLKALRQRWNPLANEQIEPPIYSLRAGLLYGVEKRVPDQLLVWGIGYL